jgi:hypothetical protein
MSRNEISSFAFKILGIICIIFAISSLENLFAYVIYTVSNAGESSVDVSILLLSATVPFTILIIAGIILLKKSDSWGQKFWTTEPAITPQSAITKDEVQIIGFSLIGLLLLAFSIPKLFKIIVALIESLSGTGHAPYSSYVIKDIIFVFVQIALGTYLFIGSIGLNKFWKQIQKTRG